MMAYIIHRNAQVADFEKAPLRSTCGVFSSMKKKLTKASRGMLLYTANGNEVPLPAAKSPEAFGFASVCEIMEDAIWAQGQRHPLPTYRPGLQCHLFRGRPRTKQNPRSREEMEYLIRFLKQLGDMDTEENANRRRANSRSYRKKQGARGLGGHDCRLHRGRTVEARRCRNTT